jgi:hypothetical protein
MTVYNPDNNILDMEKKIGYDIDDIVPQDNGFTKFGLYRVNNIYPYPWARIGPFLTSYGASNLVKDIIKLDCADKIVRIHTDSIMLSEKLENIELSDKLGGWKIEKEGNYKIKHVNDVKLIK